MKKINYLFLFIMLSISIGSCREDDLDIKHASVQTTAVTNITATTATSGGNITDDGGSAITARGVCYSTSHNPTIDRDTTSNGTGTGSFTSKLTGLTANTTYYVRAYATNVNETIYGDEIQFSTTTTLPTLTTKATTNITSTTATSGGNITDDGGSTITAFRVCYSSSPNPTTADFTINVGAGIGSFTCDLVGLTSSTTYYVRAYATNVNGTAYGNEVQFTSGDAFPGQTVYVAGGTFNMGSNDGDSDEQPIHSVTVDAFYISKYEITNQQYADFMNAIGANSDGSYDGTEYLDIDNSGCQIEYSGEQFIPQSGKENYPAIYVSWYGAKAYAEYYGGRLPTEAEWEFAARGGNSSNGYIYSGSDNIDDVAWYYSNSDVSTHTIGTKNSNELGIYDMSGNVWEWCNDWYDSDYYSSSPSDNPQGPSTETGALRVARGGSWRYQANYCRVACRSFDTQTNAYYRMGFRPVFVP